jgi:ppGpp synthetase/RelA/SpoT-type nucleotidyltranferase
MNLDEYETKYFPLYAAFTEVVELILEKAIASSALPRPQSIQSRAKSISSLRDRLREAGKLGASNIEHERRDLAGARLIFYTNTDADSFFQSSLIFDNFEVERDATRVHHPTKENNQRRYRARHYTVRLKESRADLPEYKQFKGLRAEIQVQTILNHAWSETSHDIIYKNKPVEGFANNAMEAIRARFDRIMDKYLLPAGYELQQVQHDWERIKQGKALFDRGILVALGAAPDNTLQ